MASIKKRGDSYLIRVSGGYDADHNQIRYSKTWKPQEGWSEQRIQKELNKAAVVFEEECLHGGHAAPNNITFKELTEIWFKEEGKDHRKTTLYREHQIADRVNEVLGDIRLKKLTRNDIQTFITNLGENGANKRNGKPLKQKTIKHHSSFIHTVLEFAVDKEYISDEENPYRRIHIPKRSSDGESLLSKKKQIYTEEEADKLTELLADAPMKYAVFISISLSIGSRRSETIGLKWDKVRFDKDLISIEATTNYTPADGIFDDTTKNETSIRTVKVEPGLCELMRLYKRTQEDQKAKLGTKWEEGGYLFTQWDGKPMHPNTPYIWLKKLCDKNGLPFYGIHALRHYNISYRLKCKEDIASVSAAAGHSSPRTTLQIYSHMIAESQAENSIPLAEPIDCTKLLAKKTKTIDQAPQQEMLKSARTVVITRSKPQTRNNPTFGVKRKTRKPRK